VGTLRLFDIAIADPLPLALVLRNLGQDILSPPNVKGWPGGEVWINTTTLLARKQYLDRLTRASTADTLAMQVAAGRDSADMGRNASDRTITAQGAANDDTIRQQRFARQMERGLASLDFDSARWIAQFPGATAAERGRAAQRLLLATAPQQPPYLDADSRTLVHAILLDAAYQLK
jgi:hypothetical protein